MTDDEQLAQALRAGQVECLPGQHTAWHLDLGCCSWCKAAI